MAKKNVEKDEEIGLEKKSLIRTDSESSSTSSTFNQGKILIFNEIPGNFFPVYDC